MPKTIRESERELPPLPMPPVPMPPLPEVPVRSWGAAPKPSASTVQQAYLARREEELLARAPSFEQYAYTVIREYLGTLPGWKPSRVSAKDVKAAYEHINRAMQSSDVTINFDATAWFSDENPYDSYTQMYERCVGADGVMVLKDNPMNEAETRTNVDNKVTFPEDWANAVGAPRRGLAPNQQSRSRIMAQMHTGKLVQVNPVDRSAGYRASNAQFNPHTKQVFAALNYSRCENGGATGYGYSHFILKPELKVKALYFPMDTFQSGSSGAIAQIPYSRLASILACMGSKGPLARAGAGLMTAIFDSCYHGKMPPSMTMAGRIIEAHVFSEIRFRGHVEAMVLSPRSSNPAKEAPFSTLVANAKKFATKHGITLYQSR